MTRAYFQNEALNETDPLLNSIEDTERRNTLIAGPMVRAPGGWISGCRAKGRQCSWTSDPRSSNSDTLPEFLAKVTDSFTIWVTMWSSSSLTGPFRADRQFGLSQAPYRPDGRWRGSVGW